jgi:hypothetical protein
MSASVQPEQHQDSAMTDAHLVQVSHPRVRSRTTWVTQAVHEGEPSRVNAMRYIRFVVLRRNRDSGVSEGVFPLAYQLRDSADVQSEERTALADHLAWFEKNLNSPTRFNRTKSKGYYRRNSRGIAWFKDTAVEHLARMHEIKAILERCGHPVEMLVESRLGYVTHDDAFQVVAEPFSDTQTE